MVGTILELPGMWTLLIEWESPTPQFEEAYPHVLFFTIPKKKTPFILFSAVEHV